jgi:hypothetical protein
MGVRRSADKGPLKLNSVRLNIALAADMSVIRTLYVSLSTVVRPLFLTTSSDFTTASDSSYHHALLNTATRCALPTSSTSSAPGMLQHRPLKKLCTASSDHSDQLLASHNSLSLNNNGGSCSPASTSFARLSAPLPGAPSPAAAAGPSGSHPPPPPSASASALAAARGCPALPKPAGGSSGSPRGGPLPAPLHQPGCPIFAKPGGPLYMPAARRKRQWEVCGCRQLHNQ